MRLHLDVRAVLFGLLTLGACGGAHAPHEYPPAAQTEFHSSCPASNPVCACTWERITRTMPHEEYEAAMERFRADGLMDPRLTRASTACREKHAG